MDSTALIQMQKLPFRQRLEEQYRIYEAELEKGYMTGRMGMAPVGRTMQYRGLRDGHFRDTLVFGSNSYLGLSHDPYVIAKVQEAAALYGIGTGGSPAFSGYTQQHAALEKRLAALAGHEDAVLLPGGYMANLCWVNGLMNRNDVIVYDKNSHASVINAIKMTGVPFYSFDPENLDQYEAILKRIQEKEPERQIFSTIEGVRSVDGRCVDVARYIEISRRYDAITILDDAHGLGTVGATGKGTLEHLGLMGQVDMRMSTCSKALGAQGAFVSGSAKLIFYLRNFAFPYVFTTALAQTTVAAINAALDVLEREPQRLAQLHANVRYMQDGLEAQGLSILRGDSGIIPVFLPAADVRAFNRRLYARGLFANIMEYPMVPPGLERLRLSIMSTHTHAQMDRALELIRETCEEFGLHGQASEAVSRTVELA